MSDNMTRGERNLELLRKSVPSGGKLYLWCLMPDGQLLATDCPEAELFEAAFRAMGGLDRVLRHAEGKNPLPLLIGSATGMQWAAVCETDERGQARLIFLVGPAFYRDISVQQLREGLQLYGSAAPDPAWEERLADKLNRVPVVSYALLRGFAVLVHNVLNDQQLSVMDISAGDAPKLAEPSESSGRDRHRIWQAEQALLSMVRNGELDYSDALRDSEALSDGVPVRGRDPLRQAKTSMVVFTSLVCRAAIEGGLNPDIAYSLGDNYIQAAEDSRELSEVTALANAMYDDFIHRVHRLRTNPSYSGPVRKCCDYIELNLSKPIRIGELGSLVGYSDYYLSEKFRKETGIPITTYIRNARVERAKLMLRCTDKSVSDIAENLAFNTVNYFIQCFRTVTGCTPAQYRRQERDIS